MTPISEVFLGRSISRDIEYYYRCSESGVSHIPSISEGLSRSILIILPVESAKIRTLLATCAATKSADIENCSWTGSTLNTGSDSSSSAMLQFDSYGGADAGQHFNLPKLHMGTSSSLSGRPELFKSVLHAFAIK